MLNGFPKFIAAKFGRSAHALIGWKSPSVKIEQ
jgi:hypothetical protein